jgi:very-short-patch-repair endonuclease
MMQRALNIVEYIQDNPIKTFSDKYNEKFLNEIKKSFVEYEEQLFIDMFYHHFGWRCYERHGFSVDLDNVWKMIGFTQKGNAKRMLEKYFILDKDYKIEPVFICEHEKIKLRCKICDGCHICQHNIIKSTCNSKKCVFIEVPHRGGHNLKSYILTKHAFKCLCAKAGTKEGDKIFYFYEKVENIIECLYEEQFLEMEEELDNVKHELNEIDDDAEFIKFSEKRQKREQESKKNDFTKNLDDLLYLTSQKRNLTKHLTTNYKENVHYIIDTNIQHKSQTRHGGHNIVIYMLTEEAFELFKSSYNLRNRYIVELNDKIKCINNYAMCIENQTIGFIENSFKDVLNCKRQYKFDKYRVDLYFIDYKLIVECDEHGHNDRDKIKEKIREDYLISLGNKIIRYNPNDASFDLSNVLREIYKVIMTTSL